MKIGKNIIVTYYYSYGRKITKTFKLLDVVGFSYILVKYGNQKILIPFFDRDSMIETITREGHEKPLYYNPHLKEDMYDGYYIKDEYYRMINENFFKAKNFNSKEIDEFIEKYNNKTNTFEYDDLFFTAKQKEEFENFFEQLIKELSIDCKSRGLDADFKLLSKGTTSYIYSIGDKIVKIGKPRRKPILPYCEYLLQPIINKEFEFDGYPIHIEVTQKALVCENLPIGLLNDKFINIANTLRDRLEEIGLKSFDLIPTNVGILLQDNRIHFDSVNFDTSNDDITSILNNNNLRIRGKGEFVLIDLDSLYIVDIEKYCTYLRNIGVNEKKIEKLERAYGKTKNKR